MLQPLGILPKPSSSLSIAKSIAAGMGPEIRDDVAASSPLAALTMSRETKKQGKFVHPCSVVVWCSRGRGICLFEGREEIFVFACSGADEQFV